MHRMVRLSEKNSKDRIAKGVSLVEFDTPWCSPCRAQDSIVGELEKDFHDRATIATVNIDRSRTIALKLKIQSVPTIIIFKEGLECKRFVGIQTVETLNRAMKNAMVQSPE